MMMPLVRRFGIDFSYGLLVGAMFMSLDYKLDDTVSHGFSAIIWVSALTTFIFIFKAFYFAEQYPVYIQETVGHNPCHRMFRCHLVLGDRQPDRSCRTMTGID